MSKKDSKDPVFGIYQSLLEESNIADESKGLMHQSRDRFSEEDSEFFMSSEDIVKQKTESDNPDRIQGMNPTYGKIEESIYFQRYTKRRQHKYTETEMAELRQSCVGTIVHDYGEFDIFHISDEERLQNDQLAEISMKLGGLKRTYRRIDQYIEAMRIVYQAWMILAKINYIHPIDEFFELVSKGNIVSNRIIMPKMKKMDQYNMETILAYISNPEWDASHLVPDNKHDRYDSFFDDEEDIESEEEEMNRLLSEDEIRYILDHMDNPEKIQVRDIKHKYIRGYDQRNYKRKNESKKDRRIREELAPLLNKIQNGSHYRDLGASYMVTHSLFEPKKKEESFWDKALFGNSWADEDAVMLYDIVMKQEMLQQHPDGERYLTYGDKQLDQFFRILEDNGVSVMDLRRRIGSTRESDVRRVEKLTKKENKKIESELIQRIAKLNNDPKFKKIVGKAEEALNKYKGDEL